VLRWARLASDCTNAVISIAQTMLGPYNQITKEIKEDALAFQEMEFVHDRREANHDASEELAFQLNWPAYLLF